MNPPYGPETGKWLAKLSRHGDGIALVFARTETAAFFDFVWPVAHAIMFLRGRLSFHSVDGSQPTNNAGSPSVLIAYGESNAAILKNCRLDGIYLDIPQKPPPLFEQLGESLANDHREFGKSLDGPETP